MACSSPAGSRQAAAPTGCTDALVVLGWEESHHTRFTTNRYLTHSVNDNADDITFTHRKSWIVANTGEVSC